MPTKKIKSPGLALAEDTGPFHEITEERYYELLECLPPARMQSDWFFVGEPYYRNLYALCFESDG